MQWSVDIKSEPLAVAHHMLVAARLPNDILQFAMAQLSVYGSRLGYTCLISVSGTGSLVDADKRDDTSPTSFSLKISASKE